MQFNQPMNHYFNEQCYTYPTPFQLPNILGEGDVISLTMPNGNIQYYFIPVHRRDQRITHPFSPIYQPNNPSLWPVGPEAWLVRRISNPIFPSFIQNQLANINDPFLKSYYASKGVFDASPQNGYFQKFHNDNVTSTTDIHYFYPKLRQNNVKYSTGVQVDVPTKSHKTTQYEVQSFDQSIPSNKKILRINNNKIDDRAIDTTDSAMSIDEKQPCQRHKKSVRISFKNYTKCKDKQHSERQSCKCVRNKTDKKVTTYSDQSSGCVDTSGRETQTVSETVSRSLSKTELSDVNTATSCESCCRLCEHCTSESNADCCE